jgi:hypothetical protein
MFVCKNFHHVHVVYMYGYFQKEIKTLKHEVQELKSSYVSSETQPAVLRLDSDNGMFRISSYFIMTHIAYCIYVNKMSHCIER